MLREWWENEENGCTDLRSLDLTCSVLPLMKRDGQIFITQPVPERKSSPRCSWWKPEPLSHWGPFRRNILPWWPSSSPCALDLFNVDWDDWNSCELWVTKNSEPVKVSNVTATDWHGLTWSGLTSLAARMKYITTIDFGQLTTEDPIDRADMDRMVSMGCMGL